MLGALANVRNAYKNKGWQCSVKNNKIISINSKYNDKYFIREFNIDSDITNISNIYKCFCNRYNGAFVRNTNKILWNNLKESIGKKVWVVHNQALNMIAYFVTGDMEENSFSIYEYGCLNDFDDSFDDIIELFCSLQENDKYRIEFSGKINTSYDILSQDQYWGYMYRLITPFQTDINNINSTSEFIYHLHGINEINIENIYDSNSLFWYTDNF